MNLDLENQSSLELDPNQYEPDTDAVAFAKNVSHAIEVRRVRLGGVKGGQRNSLLVALSRNQTISESHHINRKHWFEFLTDGELVMECCKGLNVSEIGFLGQCLDKLHPPNWETLFWKRAYIQTAATGAPSNAMQEIFLEEEKKQWKKTMASASAKKRHASSNAARDWVIKEWRDSGKVGHGGNKTDFARAFVPRVLRERGVEVTEKTIRESWLKGL